VYTPVMGPRQGPTGMSLSWEQGIDGQHGSAVSTSAHCLC
jgi:hypothetical protein